MNPSSVDIKDKLVAESLGLVFATNLFIGKEPASPENCVTIFDTPGRPPEVFFDASYTYNYPSIQIRVRDNNYLDGWELLNNIKGVLHNEGPETWNDTVYTSIVCIQEPALLDWDENDRARFVATFDIQRY